MWPYGGAKQSGQTADQLQRLSEPGTGKDQYTGKPDRREPLANRGRGWRGQRAQADPERQQGTEPEAGGGEMKELGEDEALADHPGGGAGMADDALKA